MIDPQARDSKTRRELATLAEDDGVPELSIDLAAKAAADGLTLRGLAQELHLSDHAMRSVLRSGDFREVTVGYAAAILDLTEDEARSKLPLPYCQCAGHCGKRVLTPGARYLPGHNMRGLVKYAQADGRIVSMDPFDDHGRRRGFIKGHRPAGNFGGAHALALAKLEARAGDPSAEELIQDLARKAVAEGLSLRGLASRIGMNYVALRDIVYFGVCPAPKTLAKIAGFLGITVMMAGTKFKRGYEQARLDRGSLTGIHVHTRKAEKDRTSTRKIMGYAVDDLREGLQQKYRDGKQPVPSRLGAKTTILQRQRLSINGLILRYPNRQGAYVVCVSCQKLKYAVRYTVDEHRTKGWDHWHDGCHRVFLRLSFEEQAAYSRLLDSRTLPRVPENVHERVQAYLLLDVRHFAPARLAGPSLKAELVSKWAHRIDDLIPPNWDDLYPRCNPLLHDEPIRADWFRAAPRHWRTDPAQLLAARLHHGGPTEGKAAEFLTKILPVDVDVLVAQVKEAAEREHQAWRTVQRAATDIGVKRAGPKRDRTWRRP